MFKNYLIVALRHLRRGRAFTFINVAGLALGGTAQAGGHASLDLDSANGNLMALLICFGLISSISAMSDDGYLVLLRHPDTHEADKKQPRRHQ